MSDPAWEGDFSSSKSNQNAYFNFYKKTTLGVRMTAELQFDSLVTAYKTYIARIV
jgi:hypothetical protein